MISIDSSDTGSCNFTNDTDSNYSRGFVTTKTKHLAADVLVTISGTDSSDKGVTAGYIFNLTGNGSDDDPYNFGLLGLRYYNGNPQYFLSYYTGVRGKKGSVNDITSDYNDFDNTESTNSAIEWAVDGVDGWQSGKLSSTVADGKATIYVKMTPYAGTTQVTNDNYSDNKDKLDSIKVELYAADADGNFTGSALISKTFSKDKLTKSAAAPSNSRKLNDSDSTPELTIDQYQLGYYAMVSKGASLSCTWKLGGGTGKNIVKSATNPNGEVFIWDDEIDNVR